MKRMLVLRKSDGQGSTVGRLKSKQGGSLAAWLAGYLQNWSLFALLQIKLPLILAYRTADSHYELNQFAQRAHSRMHQ
jgi:hypothetical protein